jgi:hypothetical protein
MNSARGSDWNRSAFQWAFEYVVGAGAEKLNPFDAGRASRDVVGDAKREHYVASTTDELAYFFGRPALTIGQVCSRHCVQDCGAMRRL